MTLFIKLKKGLILARKTLPLKHVLEIYLGDSLTEIIPIASVPNSALRIACSFEVIPQILTKVLVLGISLSYR